MFMNLLRQPSRSYVCGQTCVGMITGMDMQELFKMYGHQRATTQPEHVKILKKLGYDVSEQFSKVDNRRKYDLPDLCLIRIGKSGRRMGHMVVHNKGKFYDPAIGIFDSKEELLKRYPRWRIECFLAVGASNKDKVVQIPQKQQLQRVAGEKRFRVMVSHDIHNKGYNEYIERIISEGELENLRKSTKFRIVSQVQLKEVTV